MPTNEELLNQMYKQQTLQPKMKGATQDVDESVQNWLNAKNSGGKPQQTTGGTAQGTETGNGQQTTPPTSAEAPVAGAAQGNTPEAPANGQSTAPATGTGETTTPATPDTSGASGGQSLWDRYRDYLNKLGDYKTPTPNSQEDYIRQMYEANLAANKSQLESDYNQNLSDLGAEESKLGQIYYEQMRQAQAESDRNRQAFQEYANARGLNSGTGGQAELANQNQLSANLNTLRQSEAEKRAEVERQRVLLGQQYQNAIQKAQAENDLAKAKALYEEAVRVDEAISAASQADADRAMQIFNMLNNTALSAAGAYASQGDMSLYQKLLAGDSTKELEDLYNKAQQIASTGGYYSGGGGSGGYKQATSDEMEWAQYYIDLIRSAGGIDNVQDYLATNYKDYGIPYQTVSKTTASMAERARGYSTNEYQIGSEKGRDIANSLGTGNTYQAADGSVWRKSSNGNIYVTKDGVTMKANIR